MTTLLLVAWAAAVGAVIRWMTVARAGKLGTAVVNLVGAFAAGVVVGSDIDGLWVEVLTIGLLGSLTTVSGLAADVATTWRTTPLRAVVLAAASVVSGVGAAWCGLLSAG